MSEVITLKLGFANAFLIRDRGNILVDTGIHVTKEKYIELFVELGMKMQDLDLIIISHGHGDHFAHACELKKMSSAPILCHKNANYALQTAQNAAVVPRNELGKRVFKMIEKILHITMQGVNPDIVIDSNFDLSPYGVAGAVIYTPGHTDCSISVVLQSGQAIVGDIFVHSPFNRELCLAYFAYNERALLESVYKLLGLAHIFYGSHGGPFTKEEILRII